MGKLSLEGMLFKSHIGVYEYEQQYGNNFEVDVYVESKMITGDRDSLSDTIDYDNIYQHVKAIMGNKYHLIEYAANVLLVTLVNNIKGADCITVRLTKLHPPLGGDVKKVSAELRWVK
jgi:dihydroneopterin aldolase